MQPVVVALGGNALRPGRDSLEFPQLPAACEAMAGIAPDGLVVTHGNGPQIGLLATAYRKHGLTGLDVLGAETEGWLGYLIEQELGNLLPESMTVSTLLTRVEVAASDPAFKHPEKPIGPWLNRQSVESLRNEGWQFQEQGNQFRRLVASPRPLCIFQLNSIKRLVNDGPVICVGGGGIPVVRTDANRFEGVDAVVDKDYSSAMLAQQLNAKLLILATDVDGVYTDWQGAKSHKLDRASPGQLIKLDLPAGSMKPKVEAACSFVQKTGSPAVIGSLKDLEQLLYGDAGTVVSTEEPEPIAGQQ